VQPGVHPKVADEDVLSSYRVSSRPPTDYSPASTSSHVAAAADTTIPPVDENDSGQSEGEGDGKLSEFEMRRIGGIIAKEVSAVMVKKADYTLYDRDMVFEDNIRGKTFLGGAEYIKQMALFKMYMHFKYIYTRVAVDSLTVEPDDATVVIKWTVSGLGMYKVFIYYIPRRLWRVKNMEAFADRIASGVSTYHIGNHGRVIRHILDVREIDKDKVKDVNTNRVEQIKAKMAKLKPNVPAPAPSLYEKIETESSKNDQK